MCNEEKRGMGGERKQVLWLTRRFMEFGTEYYPIFSEADGKAPINFNHPEFRHFPGYPEKKKILEGQNNNENMGTWTRATLNNTSLSGASQQRTVIC